MQPFSRPEWIRIFFPASRKEGREGSCSTACKGGGAWEGRAAPRPRQGAIKHPLQTSSAWRKTEQDPVTLGAAVPHEHTGPWGDAHVRAVLGLARMSMDIPKRRDGHPKEDIPKRGGVSLLAPLWAGCWTGSSWLPVAAPSPSQELEGISLRFSPHRPHSPEGA